MPSNPKRTTVALWIIAYSLVASTLLVFNKLAVGATGSPAAVTGAQLVVSAFVPVVLQLVGFNVLGRIERKKLIPFFLFTCLFAGGLFTNMQALHFTNVGAVIGAGCALPLLVNAIEVIFMGKPIPGPRNVASLLGVISAASLYIYLDSGVRIHGRKGFFWLSLWWLLLALSNIYGKHITEITNMSQWERVFYTNTFSTPPMIVFFFANDEFRKSKELSSYGASVTAISCALGVAISYTGWKCRGILTATTFSLVGCLNKMLTIMLSMLAWPEEFSIPKTMALAACIGFGFMYREPKSC